MCFDFCSRWKILIKFYVVDQSQIEGVYKGCWIILGFIFCSRTLFRRVFILESITFLTKSSRIVHFQLILLIFWPKVLFSGIFFWRLFFLESLTDYFRSRTPLAEGLAAWFDLDLSHLGPNCNLDPSLFLESLTPPHKPHTSQFD